MNVPSQWTDAQTRYLAGHFGITSLAEFTRHFNKSEEEVKTQIDALGLKARWLAQCPTPEIRQRQEIRLLMQLHKRYLPNGWLIGLAMGNLMLRALGEQIERAESFIEEIEEEINDVLDAIVRSFELTPLLTVGDMLKGADHGQSYRITGREFVPASKWITYYFAYLYGGADIPEEYDDEENEEEEGGFRLSDN